MKTINQQTESIKAPPLGRSDASVGGLAGGLLGIINLRIEACRWAASHVAKNGFFNDLFRSLQEQDFVFKAQLQTELRTAVWLPVAPQAKEWQTMLANVALPPSKMSLAAFFEFLAQLHQAEVQATAVFLRQNNENAEWTTLLKTRQEAGELLVGALAFLEQFEEEL